MKILKILVKLILGLFLLLIVALFIILGVESNYSSYLYIDEAIDQKPHSYIIANVNLITMQSDTVQSNKYVQVDNGFITQIGDSISDKSYPIIDAEGLYLMPGLIDMHVHVWDKQELGLYLANGITAVRNLWGMPMHLRMKEKINAGELIGPNFFTSGPKLTGVEFLGDDNLNLYSPDEAREKVISYKKRGYDFIKSYYGISEDIFAALLKQSEISGIDVAAHTSPKVPYNYHFHPQIRSIEHAEDVVQNGLNYQLDSMGLEEIIKEYRLATHSSFSPTLTVFHNIHNLISNDKILQSESVKYLNPLIKLVDSRKQFDRWQGTRKINPKIEADILRQHQFHLYIIKRMHEEGINIICSTDAGIGITPPGLSIHTELAFYKEAGLSNFEALQTATTNAAETHAIMANLGSLKKGKVANMLLLDANPLEDLGNLKNPVTVFSRGLQIERKQLKMFVSQAYERNNLISTAINYVEFLWVEK
jgi:imidazolonepropionase-like amidohydrolase